MFCFYIIITAIISAVDDRDSAGDDLHGLHWEGQVWADSGGADEGGWGEGDVSVPRHGADGNLCRTHHRQRQVCRLILNSSVTSHGSLWSCVCG